MNYVDNPPRVKIKIWEDYVKKLHDPGHRTQNLEREAKSVDEDKIGLKAEIKRAIKGMRIGN